MSKSQFLCVSLIQQDRAYSNYYKHIFTNQSINQSINQSVSQTVNQSINILYIYI